MIFVIILSASLILQFISKIIKNNKMSNIFDYLSISSMFFLSGLRYDVGRDFWGYYNNMASQGYNVEVGARYLINVVQYLKLDMQAFIFALSFFTGLFLYLTIKYYDQNKKTRYISIILIFSLLFFNSLNISRQILAASVFAYSTRFIVEKKIIRFILYVLLAASFHMTAVFLLAIYPISMLFIKLKNKRTLFNLTLLISIINMFVPFISNWIKWITLYITSSIGKYNSYFDRIIGDDNYFSTFNLIMAILLLVLINLNNFKKNTVLDKDKYNIGMFIQFMAVLFILFNSILNFSTLTMRFYYYFTIFVILTIGSYKNLFYTTDRYINTIYKLTIGAFALISTTNSILGAIYNSMLNLYPFNIRIFDIIFALK
ncbi:MULTISPECIES: EpsG family protein [unclassified Sedimentibacter]|uniref:EpsG family protein n=1 Tax=unclassified Sedimentibacter TaxID=2649220 RepID=UPI0027E15CEE|nr:EpsG family protein [Sedimentibacter sp. MB35-C1]WMJ78082.1 EpsG family protein [Sedimentibacter sp. MB35-C1]